MPLAQRLLLSLAVLFSGGVIATAESSDTPKQASAAGRGSYLFASFRDNGQDGLHLAYSHDGLTWTALRDDSSFLKPTVGGKLMRDPCVMRGPDGRFHMVWTTGWNDKGFGVAHSDDLIRWTEQAYVPAMAHEPAARNTWAPEIIWDDTARHYVIFWSSTIPGKFPATDKTGDDGYNHRIYATTTKDFKTYSKTRLMYDPGFNVIDPILLRRDGRYILVLKDETRTPPAKNLRLATAPAVDGPWVTEPKPFTHDWVEGPAALKVGDDWIVYFDEYTRHRYGAMRTRDFKTWENISDKLHFPKGTRHGTAFEVPPEVLEKLRGPDAAPAR